MVMADKATPNLDRRTWSAELLCLPFGVLMGAAIFLTAGHPWSVLSFSSEAWGVWSAPLFAANFTIICIAAWRAAVLIQRVGRGRGKSACPGDVWDRELDC